jgi:serine/threonine protein kinase
MYPRQRQEDEYHNAQILRQVEIIGLLDHPNIVKIYYFTRTLDTWLLYLEHAGSINLAHFITQRGSLSDDGLALRFARQIGAALRYCHLHCVLHNDIRSEKIIVTQHDDIKITGFSSSEFMDERGDECFDTFSYGTIIYHMLWGIAPWPPENNCAWHLDSRTPVTSNLTMHQTPNLSSCTHSLLPKTRFLPSANQNCSLT